MTPLERLKSEFSIFVLKNKSATPTELFLRDGESVNFPGFSTKKVASANIIQIPNSVFFEFISPTISDLVRVGVIGKPVSLEEKQILPIEDKKGSK